MKTCKNTVFYKDEELKCYLCHYPNNVKALALETKLGEAYGQATVNLGNQSENDTVIRKEYYEAILKSGIIKKTIKEEFYGFKSGYLVELNTGMFTEY